MQNQPLPEEQFANPENDNASKLKTAQLLSFEASKTQTAAVSDVNFNVEPSKEQTAIQKSNQSFYHNRQKISQKKQLLKKNFHQELDLGKVAGISTGADKEGDQAQSARNKIIPRASEYSNCKPVLIENSQLGIDKADAVNISQKHIMENQSFVFDQSLPIKYEEEGAHTNILQKAATRGKQKKSNYQQLPSNSFEQSLDGPLNQNAQRLPPVEDTSKSPQISMIGAEPSIEDVGEQQKDSRGAPRDTNDSDQRKNIFENNLKRIRNFQKDNDQNQKITQTRSKSTNQRQTSQQQLESREVSKGIKFEKIDLQKPCLVKLLVCDGKIKVDQDQQEFYQIDPQIEIKYKSKIMKTNIARIGIFLPVFNHMIKFHVNDYNEKIEINLYIHAISQNVPVARRFLRVKDFINVDGEPINKWINLFKLPAFEEKKEFYAGRIRMKIAAVNTDNRELIDLVSNDNYLLKTKINSNKLKRRNSVRIEPSLGLETDDKPNVSPKIEKDEPLQGQNNDDNNSVKTESSEQAIKSQKYTCSDHSHSHEDDDHDLVLLGLSQPRRKIDKKKCIIYPDDKIATAWEGFISIILLTSCFTTPISLAFPLLEEEYYNYKIFSIVIDLIFLMEIILNFRYAFEDETYQIVDDPKKISKKYLQSWFAIDVTAIFPIDLIMSATLTSEDSGRSGKANQFIRMSRIGKLYKLVRVTRLLRLAKMAKKKSNFMSQIGQQFKLGEGFERLLFSIVIFIIFSHFSACFWIFTAGLTTPQGADEDDSDITNWIISGEYTKLSRVQLYTTSFYFTITTMTTVGYGDISGTNTGERIVCCFLMIMGVLFFTYASGTITNIITNEEEENKKYQEKKMQLTNLYKKHGKNMRSELYIELLQSIQFTSNNDLEEFNDFIETLPTKLKNECILLIHRPTYSTVTYLQYKPKQFLAWICPKLKPQLFPQDQYIYVDGENVEGIYFLVRGAAGFVLKESKQQQNIVYVEISQGDDFGQVDIVSFAVDNSKNLMDAFDYKDIIKRQFNCQTLTEVELMLVDMETLQRMTHEFYEGFKALFTDADIRLRRTLKQKLRAIKLSEKGLIENDHEEQFKLRFKDLQRTSKNPPVGEEREDEPSGNKQKEHQHQHEKPSEYQGKILFSKQSIPIKRLLERSLSETMQTPPNHSDSSGSEQAEYTGRNDEKKEGTFGGIRGLFSKQGEPNQDKPIRGKSLKEVFKLTKTKIVKEQVVLQMQKGLSSLADQSKIKNKASDKKKKQVPIQLNFKDDNKANLENKIKVLNDKKQDLNDLLSNDSNPVLKRLAQNLKERIQTERSNIIQKSSERHQSIEAKPNNQGKLSLQQQQNTFNFGLKQANAAANGTQQHPQMPNQKLVDSPVPILEEPEPLMSEGLESQMNPILGRIPSQDFEYLTQTQHAPLINQNQFEFTQMIPPNLQRTQTGLVGSGLVSPVVDPSPIQLNQPSILGANSNASFTELQNPSLVDIKAQIQQQQMMQHSQMIKNMGVMFQTLNMMEEFHLNQMNEMRNQINALSHQKTSSQLSHMAPANLTQQPQTSTKKRSRLMTTPAQTYKKTDSGINNIVTQPDLQIGQPNRPLILMDSQNDAQEVHAGTDVLEKNDQIAFRKEDVIIEELRGKQSIEEENYSNNFENGKDQSDYDWTKKSTPQDSTRQNDDIFQPIKVQSKLRVNQPPQGQDSTQNNQTANMSGQPVRGSKSPMRKKILKQDLITGRSGFTSGKQTPTGLVVVNQSFDSQNPKTRKYRSSMITDNSFGKKQQLQAQIIDRSQTKTKSADSNQDLRKFGKEFPEKSSTIISKDVIQTSRVIKDQTDIQKENSGPHKVEDWGTGNQDSTSQN